MNQYDDRPDDRPDDRREVEERLRRALQAEAESITPRGDGLARIRERTAARRGWRTSWRPALALGAAAAVAGAAAGVGFAVFRAGDAQVAGPVAQPSVAPSTPSTAQPAPTPPVTPGRSGPPRAVPPPAPAPTPTVAAAPGGQVTVPVYYLADQHGQPRLYREFHLVPLRSGSPVVTALYEMFGDRAADPDYVSAWSATARVRSARTTGDQFSVDLSPGALQSSDGLVRARSVQQLVYTVTAADNTIRRVRLTVGGAPLPEAGGPLLTRAPRIDVEGPVWILEPVQGQRVARSFTVRGIASVFEANVSYDVRRGGRTVLEGFATAESAAPSRAAWRASLTLAPGTYELRAYERSAADGNILYLDTKTIVVR